MDEDINRLQIELNNERKSANTSKRQVENLELRI